MTVDTLRADHLGAYGSTTVATPALDRLAADGALFERAYSQTQVTVPSHVSIMTSLPVALHGVRTNRDRLAQPAPHLAALFHAAGYRTAGIASSKHLGPGWGLGELLGTSLDEFQVPERLSEPWVAEETTDRALAWLTASCRAPAFLWVHYWDPHMPYQPPRVHGVRYYDGDPTVPHGDGMRAVDLGRSAYDESGFRRAMAAEAAGVKRLKRELGVRTRVLRQILDVPAGPAVAALDPDGSRGVRPRLRAVGTRVRRRLPLRRPGFDWLRDVRDVAYPRAQYAGEVTYVDAQLGRLRDGIERLGLAPRTILVVTADHGESLGEHGVWFDHMGLHEPNLHIPLLVWAPGRVAPARRADVADTLDVAPTVLRLAGLEPAPGMRGRDLFAPAVPAAGPHVAELVGGNQLAVRDGRWKLIRTDRDVFHADSFWRDAGTVELYDLGADPAEATDRAASEPEQTRALLAVLDAWSREMHAAAAPPPAVPPERARSLRALGYLD